MYRHIYVPIDSSEWSNRAIDLAVELGKAFGARLTGCHVYAGRLHDYRFKQMEYTLPEEYRAEPELERQRKVHDSLIALGLRLISDSYLDVMACKAEAAGLQFERKVFDGRHYRVLIQDVRESDYDLVVMGALGMGAVKDSQLGSVTERFVRQMPVDTLVVRNPDPSKGQQGAIVVGLDGSPRSFRGLQLGIALSRAFRRPLEAIAVREPLHEECAEGGPADTRWSPLEIGRRVAWEDGVALATTLLSGKCFAVLLEYCRKERPWLLILGRTGVYSNENETALGSNAAHLLRLAPVDVLLAGGTFYPPLPARSREPLSGHAIPEK